MKRILMMMSLSLLFAVTFAAAEEETAALPQGVMTLCEQSFPGCSVVRHAGFGDEARGQFALVLSDGEHNTLAIAERKAEDSAYAWTVENPHAVHDGNDIPELYMEQVDSLFIDYDNRTYHFVKDAERWGSVSLFSYETFGKYTRTQVSYLADIGQDGMLHYERYLSDENDNTVETLIYPPIPVSDDFAQAMNLNSFDIDMLAPYPEYGISGTKGLAEGLIDGDETLITLDLQSERLVLLVETPSGMRRLRIAEWNGENGYVGQEKESADLPMNSDLDAYHATDGEVLLNITLDGREMDAYYELYGGTWMLTLIDNQMYFTANSVCDASSMYRNDGSVYGRFRLPWDDLFSTDFTTLPWTMEEAVAQMDTAGYAFVNNPDPTDRLHLRTRASRDSASLGKFYNGTPVQVLADDGTWVKVRVGLGEASLEGYMLREYLAFDMDGRVVECAFPQLSLYQEFKENGLPLRTRPQSGSPVVPGEPFTSDIGEYIIGVAGDDWFILMLRDGSVGYAPQSAFTSGNG